MGFRFSRRVKILPGIRVNFSTRGASLSVGPRGASVNFSSRGTFLNTGIPGTGLSHRERIGGGGRPNPPERVLDRQKLYSSGSRVNDGLVRELERKGTVEKMMSTEEARQYLTDPRIKFIDPNSGRKLSRRQMEAKIRAAEAEKRIDDARKEIEVEEAKIKKLVGHWLPLPEIPDRSQFANATADPFEPGPPPSPIDTAQEREAWIETRVENLRRNFLRRLLPRFMVRKRAMREAEVEWPPFAAARISEREREIERHDAETATERVRWDENQQARLQLIRRLLTGDLETIHETVSSAIEAIEFPFDTECDVILVDAEQAILHIDLPEIEDVIPATIRTVLKNGDFKERKRDDLMRNSDYQQLVLGLGVFLASQAFANAPSINVARVIGYTQRARRKSADAIDQYIFDISFVRESISEFSDGRLPIARLLRLGSTVITDAKNFMKPIVRPEVIEHLKSNT